MFDETDRVLRGDGSRILLTFADPGDSYWRTVIAVAWIGNAVMVGAFIAEFNVREIISAFVHRPRWRQLLVAGWASWTLLLSTLLAYTVYVWVVDLDMAATP